ncbi:MAG: mercuric reductase [Deltaproteobacteria bacterium]|nr:mercuric reductase [Deltaproteobacteria bacterium]MBI3388145.1 mercuric reductase [Deltaproteobacteria bacterium]
MSESMPEPVAVSPMDAHNRTLVANVHPADRPNPEPAPRYNLVVIGAGTAGLVTAAGAAALGAKVALIERHHLGGDCLNVGCVPSKCVIRSSRVIGELRDAAQLGIAVPPGAQADFAAVMARMRKLRAQISHHDSVDRFQRELGIDVFLGQARFSGPDTVEVDGKTLRFKRTVIASGARAVHPPVEGLAATGFLTNETIFNLTELPRRLAVIGGGPIGCELSQAFRRLGSEVTIIEMAPQFLVREDPDAAKILADTFQREGIHVKLNTGLASVTRAGNDKILHLTNGNTTETLAVDEILVGVGRAPNVEGLNLEGVGVKYSKRGIEVNDNLQTTNPRIYAAGDICMDTKFTHAADFAARIVIQNTLFFGRKKLSGLVMPWCTYTDPEIAHVGMYERDATQRGIAVDTFIMPLREVDRAVADGDEDGFAKVHVKKGTDQILGATVVARHAGEMINEITLAIVGKIGLGTIANVIHPYPTQAEAIRKLGDAYNRTRLTPFVKRLFQRWLAWTR